MWWKNGSCESRSLVMADICKICGKEEEIGQFAMTLCETEAWLNKVEKRLSWVIANNLPKPTIFNRIWSWIKK
jgi:hypothetical protein